MPEPAVAGLQPGFDPALLSRIEDAGLNASAAPQQRWVDGWLVRFSPGKAKRARCINAVAQGRLPIGARLDACAQIFDAARLPMIVRVTPFSLPARFDTLLEEQAWRRFDDTRVMVLSGLTEAALPLPRGVGVQSIGLESFAQRVGAFRGSSLAQCQAHAERLLAAPVPFFAFELRADGVAVACGQFALEGEVAACTTCSPPGRHAAAVTRACCAVICWRRPRRAGRTTPICRSTATTTRHAASIAGSDSPTPTRTTTGRWIFRQPDARVRCG